MTLFVPLIVVIGAVIVRSINITRLGLVHWDDGERTWVTVALNDYFAFLKNWRAGIERDAPPGSYPWDGNPLVFFLYSIVAGISGNRENAGLYTNVFLGSLGVAGVVAAGVLLFGATTGILAGVLLAVSCFHVMYSRSIYAEVSCGAFYIWATFFYLWSLTGGVWLCGVTGILIGCAFLCNSRQFYIVAFFPFYEVLVQAGLVGQVAGASRGIVAVVALAGGMVAPLLVMDVFLRALRRLRYPGLDYPRQLFSHMIAGRSRFDWRLPALVNYLKVLWETEGLTTLLMLAGAVELAAHYSLPSVIVLVQIVPPLLFWSARSMDPGEAARGSYNYSMPRFISSTIYALTLAGAYALAGIRAPIAIAILAALAAHSLYRMRFLYRMESGYKKAVDYMTRHDGPAHVSFCYPNSSFYVGDRTRVIDARTMATAGGVTLRDARTRGAGYILYSPAIHHLTWKGRVALDPDVEKIVTHGTAVFSAPLGLPPWRTAYWDEHNNPDARVPPSNLVQVFEV